MKTADCSRYIAFCAYERMFCKNEQSDWLDSDGLTIENRKREAGGGGAEGTSGGGGRGGDGFGGLGCGGLGGGRGGCLGLAGGIAGGGAFGFGGFVGPQMSSGQYGVWSGSEGIERILLAPERTMMLPQGTFSWLVKSLRAKGSAFLGTILDMKPAFCIQITVDQLCTKKREQ